MQETKISSSGFEVYVKTPKEKQTDDQPNLHKQSQRRLDYLLKNKRKPRRRKIGDKTDPASKKNRHIFKKLSIFHSTLAWVIGFFSTIYLMKIMLVMVHKKFPNSSLSSILEQYIPMLLISIFILIVVCKVLYQNQSNTLQHMKESIDVLTKDPSTKQLLVLMIPWSLFTLFNIWHFGQLSLGGQCIFFTLWIAFTLVLLLFIYQSHENMCQLASPRPSITHDNALLDRNYARDTLITENFRLTQKNLDLFNEDDSDSDIEKANSSSTENNPPMYSLISHKIKNYYK